MITLRLAGIDDLELLTYWDTKPHVIACDPDDDWNWEIELARSPSWREQFIAELNGRPIGVVQIIDPFEEETGYWGRVPPDKRAIDIWIGEETDLNQGYGTQMMQLAISRCFQNAEITGILVDPLKTNHKAHRFYKKLGFEFVEERKFNGSDCHIYELHRKDWGRPQ